MDLIIKEKAPALTDWTDVFFLVGVALVPFDNFFFAPSAGWAAIAPIPLALYVLINVKTLFSGPILSRKAWIVAGIIAFLTSFNVFIVGVDLRNLLGAFFSLACGIAVFLSLTIYFGRKQGSLQAVFDILFWAYLVSFFVGILDRFNVFGFSRLLQSVSKRYYPNKLQFTFTEPSFISMHLYGIMLPLIILFWKRCDARKNAFLFAAFVLFSLVFGSSIRFLVDTVVAAFIALLILLKRYKKIRMFVALLLPVALIAGVIVVSVVMPDRARQILENGIYGDNSLAARFFRINAILQGQIHDPRAILFGYGFSNAYIPFNLGYDSAYLEVRNVWLGEIDGLRGVVTDTFFCMPVRLFAEFGLIGASLVFSLFFKKEYALPSLLLLYLYFQFDSFAFYSFWLLLFVCQSPVFVNDAEKGEENEALYYAILEALELV